MPYIARIISGHNKKVTGDCRSQPCPLEGKCKTTNLVHRSILEAAGTTKQYIGLTSNTFKERSTGHKASFTASMPTRRPSQAISGS